jgi:hypothetical protein
MFEALCEAASRRGARRLIGRYVRSPKNAMVEQLYPSLGFRRVEGSVQGELSIWEYVLGESPSPPRSLVGGRGDATKRRSR